ncbi:MAG: FecR domain-containing protein [Gammaproteobacteria bacterium]
MNQQIYEEASEWLIDFRLGRPDRATRERFGRWLSTSPEHVRAYLEQSAIWEAVSAQPADPAGINSLIERSRQSAEKVVPLTQAPMPAFARSRRRAVAVDRARPAARSRRLAFLATAATLLIAIVGACLYFYAPRNVFTTAVGEQRSILLADGSTIDLNARSKVRVSFDKQGRHVDLLEGQALFRVAKDKARPFIVAVNGARVRAVGTQFDINQRKRGLVVTVVEGTVAVSGPVIAGHGPESGGAPAAKTSSETGGASAVTAERGPRQEPPTEARAPAPLPSRAISAETGEILLDAGQQLTLAPAVATAGGDSTPAEPHRVDVETATAWTHRRLVFETTPLEEVAAEFNRNSERTLVIRGHGLDDFHVSGAFSSTDVQPFLRFLRAQNGVEVIEKPDQIIIMRR